MIRKPAVAGQFYPGNPSELTAFLQEVVICPAGQQVERVVGVVSPHAGYLYSGRIAGAVFGRVEVPDTVVLLGPNHTGLGTPASIMVSGAWDTPLGRVPLDTDLGEAILGASPLFEEDSLAHAHEHSLEVLLPFLQFRNPSVRVVPVAFMLRSPEDAEEAGSALATVLQGRKGTVLMVASSDMTHYETQASAKQKDDLAIACVSDLDAGGLLDTAKRHRISMCGVVPTAVLIVAAKRLGSTRGDLVAYATSGDVTGDFRSVVGYAGMLVH